MDNTVQDRTDKNREATKTEQDRQKTKTEPPPETEKIYKYGDIDRDRNRDRPDPTKPEKADGQITQETTEQQTAKWNRDQTNRITYI